MKSTKKILKKITGKKTKKRTLPKVKKQPVDKIGDVKKLVELLMINQIELEHQNQELRIMQEELEISRNQYVNLYDFSPIPYFSLDRDSIIKAVNLSAGKTFGFDRNKLVGQRFVSFVPFDDRDVFNKFLNAVFTSDLKKSCELKVRNKDNRVFHVRLEGLKLEDALQTEPKCQVALIEL